MSAPSSSHPIRILVALAAALVVGGCTVPGSSRFEGPPEGLPPSLAYVTADVMGFTLHRTEDAPLEQLELPAHHERWIGETAGIALREIPLEQDEEPVRLLFADVADRRELVESLEDAAWKRRSVDGVARFHRDDGTWRAAIVREDALIAAASDSDLDWFVETADEYAVPERKAMRENAVTAIRQAPISFVFRFDLVRTQLKRPFEHDPALLELARWFTDSNMLIAMRDGWIGVTPPLGSDGESMRVVGQAEWVPDLAPGIELEPVDQHVLDQLDPYVDWAVALHDPGQQLRELVRAITIGAGQYVTGQDVAEGDEVDLLDALDSLDGDAAIGGSNSHLEAFVEGGDAKRVRQALRTARVDARVQADDGGVRIVLGRPADAATARTPQEPMSFERAGAPPRPPVAWLWRRGDDCVGTAAGWVTWTQPDRLGLSIDVALDDEPDCPTSLSTRTLESLGIPLSGTRLPSVKR